MENLFTKEQARQYSQSGNIEEWIHLFLCNEGNNVPFSEGLKLEKRYYIGPIKMPLNLFTRCCGPEEGIKYRIDKNGFEARVDGIRQRLQTGWSMPPLIINFENGVFELNDGNHRYEALIKEGIEEYFVIIWITSLLSYDQFKVKYSRYL